MRRFLVLFILIASPMVWAGDPCPIRFKFVALGSPSWLAGTPPLARLKRREKWFGIAYTDRGGETKIIRVAKGSPAERAAIRPDDVVLTVNGRRIHSQEDLSTMLDRTKPGDPVTLSLKRGAKTIELRVESDLRDPLIVDLLQTAKGQECSDASFRTSDLLADKTVMEAVFAKTHAFRCKDAHARLRKTKRFAKGEIVVVRGKRRVLIATVGWQTTCVNATDYDLDNPGQRVIDLFTRISADYADYRFEHP